MLTLLLTRHQAYEGDEVKKFRQRIRCHLTSKRSFDHKDRLPGALTPNAPGATASHHGRLPGCDRVPSAVPLTPPPCSRVRRIRAATRGALSCIRALGPRNEAHGRAAWFGLRFILDV